MYVRGVGGERGGRKVYSLHYMLGACWTTSLWGGAAQAPLVMTVSLSPRPRTHHLVPPPHPLIYHHHYAPRTTLCPPHPHPHPLPPPNPPTHPPHLKGELLEVSISCGPEAQAAAVDLILGKGVVRPLVPEDDPVIRLVRDGCALWFVFAVGSFLGQGAGGGGYVSWR